MEVLKHELATKLLAQNHILIAGTTGSGKSTLLDTLIYNLCTSQLSEKNFFIVDLKRVSLLHWENVPHCRTYARTLEDALKTIRWFSQIMDNRFAEMEKNRTNLYDGGDLYLIIDESADLLTGYGVSKRLVQEITGCLVHIGRLGRAAKMHLIYCTQAPDRKTIPSAIQQNCNALVGLRCRSALESRQAIGVSGCENLPRFGRGIVITPDDTRPITYAVPLVPTERIQELVAFWTNPTPTPKKKK